MNTELLAFQPSKEALQKCEHFIELFKEYNSHTNLMSKNDLKVIFEKHIVDSLSIVKFEEFERAEKILDIGTGGGFPSVPVSIFFENIEVMAVDSIKKKIRFIEQVKKELDLSNLSPICSRIEDLDMKEEFDIVVSRALAPLKEIVKYSLPFLKQNGYIVAYKSKNAKDELNEAQEIILKNKISYVKTLLYTIDCGEKFERCLVILKKE